MVVERNVGIEICTALNRCVRYPPGSPLRFLNKSFTSTRTDASDLHITP